MATPGTRKNGCFAAVGRFGGSRPGLTLAAGLLFAGLLCLSFTNDAKWRYSVRDLWVDTESPVVQEYEWADARRTRSAKLNSYQAVPSHPEIRATPLITDEWSQFIGIQMPKDPTANTSKW